MIAEAPVRRVVYRQPAVIAERPLYRTAPAVIAEAPRTAVYRTEPQVIAEAPTMTYGTMPVATTTELAPIAELQPTTRWSTAEPEVIAERPLRRTWVRRSQPEWIAEAPARRAWYQSCQPAPEVIAEPTCRTGGLFTPDGTTLSGRGPQLRGY